MFFRLSADGIRQPLDVANWFVGPHATSCWIVGGGPSLVRLPFERMTASLAPTFAINLAGSRLFRPDFWTAYDPSARFHRTTYLDSRVVKFVPRRRATDLVPETTFKLHDCPGAAFFELEGRSYADAICPGQAAVLDWADSLVMAIDIAYRLGFRRLFLAGCEMRVSVPAEVIESGKELGIEAVEGESLVEWAERLQGQGVSLEQFDKEASTGVYHFDEPKPLAAALATDRHYFRIAQSLRLARKCFASSGLELVSVTPGSRLNDYFSYREADDVCDELERLWGDPASEQERGRYSLSRPRMPSGIGPMRDFPPPVREVSAKRERRRDDEAFVDG